MSNSRGINIGDIRRLIANAPDDARVIIHNDSSEWYGYDESPSASLKTLYYTTAVTEGWVLDLRPERWDDKESEGAAPVLALVVEFA